VIDSSRRTSTRLGVNLSLLYAGEALSKLLGLFVFAYLNRVLTKGRYGDLEFAFGLVFVLNLLMDAGLAHYGAREASREPHRLPALATQIAAIRTLIFFGSILVLGAMALFLDGDSTSKLLVLVAGSMLLPLPLLLNWAFQSRDEMQVIAGSSLLRQVLFAAGVLSFVHSGEDILLVPIFDGAGLLTAVVVQQVLLRRRIGTLWAAAHLRDTVRVTREALPLAASAVVWSLRLFFPLLALRFLAGAEATAVFGASHRMIIALHTFVWLYFVNLLPSLSRLATPEGRAEFDRVTATSMRLVGWGVVTGSIVGGVIAPVIFRLYSPKYPEAAQLFSVMLWMIAAAFVSVQCRYALVALRHQQDELKANLAGCLVSVGCCLLAGKALTPLVAASIFVGAEVTTLVAAWLFCRRRGRPIAVLRPLAGPLLSGAISVGVVFSWAGQYPLLAGAAVVLIQAGGLVLFDRRLPRDAVELLRPSSTGPPHA